MTKHYQIKAFSQLTQVTIKALRHYDKIGLLTPSARSESGYRLYSRNDLFRLQQITTLKFMGFSLTAIKTLLNNPEFDWQQSLGQQADALAKSAEKINKASGLLKFVAATLAQEDRIEWDSLISIIGVLHMNETNVKSWFKNYLNADEYQVMQDIYSQYTDAQVADYSDEWDKLVARVQANMHHEPGSEMGQHLAKEWMTLVNKFYGDNLELKKKLWHAMRAGAIPKEFFP